MAPRTAKTTRAKANGRDEATRDGPGTARRREILSIAASVFAEKGVASSTVRDIADRAGILSGSLYHHFRSKNDLVAEVVRGGLELSASRHEATLNQADRSDPASTLRALVVGHVQWVAEQPNVASILSNDRQYLRDTAALKEVDALRQNNRLGWVEVIETGIKAHIFRSNIDPEVIVRAIFDGTLASTRWLPPVRQGDAGEIGKQLAEFYVNGLLQR